MLIATGHFDKLGNPCLSFKLAGVFQVLPGIDFEGIIDTGFTGFLALPIVRAFSLGLPLYGTTSAVLADGSTATCLTALAKMTVGQITKQGIAMLNWASSDVLLGMDFLRTFQLSLFMTKDKIILLDEDALKNFVNQAAASAPPAPQPPGALPPPQQ